MLSGLETGRGTENVLFNLLKYKPLEIDADVIVPMRNNGIRVSESLIKGKLSNAKLIRINVDINNEDSSFKIIFTKLLLKPIVKDLRKYKNTEILQKIRDTDIVYLFYNPYSIFFYEMDIPIIGSNHTDGLEVFKKHKSLIQNKYYQHIHKLYYKNINGLHVFPNNADILQSHKALKYNIILPNGIDTSMFYPDYNVKNERLRLFFVASLEYGKGLDILLPLIDKFKNNNNVEFHIAGSGSLVNEIKKRNNIIYHGVVDNNELSKLYRESDVFIYPSHSDTYSLVTLEALSSGLYVLCSDYLRQIFDDFEDKYLEYLALEIDVWYNKISEIINNREMIKHDKNNEYDYIKNNYSWEIISKKFYEYLIKFYNGNKE
jgi:glycosyltransferase involved in cell wall biosynthesis